MALPRQRQPLSKFIRYHGLTHQMVADACFKGDRSALRNVLNGIRYATTEEIDALERLLRTPITLMLEPAMLVYRNGPVLSGTAALRHEFELRAKGIQVDPDPRFYDTQLSGYRFYGPNGEIHVD